MRDVAHRIIVIARGLAYAGVDLGVHGGALHDGDEVDPARLEAVADALERTGDELRELAESLR